MNDSTENIKLKIQEKERDIERHNENIIELQKQVTLLESEIAIFKKMLEGK